MSAHEVGGCLSLASADGEKLSGFCERLMEKRGGKKFVARRGFLYMRAMPQFVWDRSRWDAHDHWDRDPAEAVKEKRVTGKLSRQLKLATIAQQIAATKPLTDALAANVPALGDTTAVSGELTSATAALKTTSEAAATAKDVYSNAIRAQNAAQENYKVKLEKVFTTCETNTENDVDKLALTGIEVIPQGRKPAVGIPAQVLNVQVTRGDEPGELEPMWDGQNPKPRLYIVRMVEGTATSFDESKMVEVGRPTASKLSVKNLKAGSYYWFQVAAVGTGDKQGPWSDPAVMMAV